MTMSEIRDRYPNPSAVGTQCGPDHYCVGGAVCRVALPSRQWAFPAAPHVADALRQLNPRLPERLAHGFATAIGVANDTGYFALAWEFVALALNLGKKA
jgi:hypothetical protein